jgi:hypothetical protein
MGALAAIVIGGCGSSQSGVSPGAYVRSVCTSLRTWSAGIKAAGTQLQAAATGTTSLGKGKLQYEAFVRTLVSDTGLVVGELKAAGTPAVSNGKRIADVLVQAFSQADAGLSRAATQAAAIPTTSAGAYQAAAQGVTISIRQTLAGIATARPEKDPQLHAAAAKEPACRALTGG